MKISKILMITFLFLLAFTSCQDNKKKDSAGDGMNEDNTQMNVPAEEGAAMEKEEKLTNEMTVSRVIEASEEHETLLAAMKSAGIIVRLNGTDIYTVFAPTDAAFGNLPNGTIDDLMKPENAEKLEGILSYHIIPGKVDSAKLIDLIKSGENGKYVLETANDGKLTATINEAGNIILTDTSGGQATVVAADMIASNGVVHSINSVLMRK